MNIELSLHKMIDIRVNEISIIKKGLINQKDNNNLRKLLEKYSIVMFYSLWEGFFCDALIEYIKFINQIQLSIYDAHECLLAYYLSQKMEIDKNVTDSKKHIIISNSLMKIINHEFMEIPLDIDVKSNTNIKVMNNLLNKLCIPCIDENKKDNFNLLLQKRNSIAHGDFTYIDNTIIFRLSKLIIESMHELTDNIITTINNNLYKKSN